MKKLLVLLSAFLLMLGLAGCKNTDYKKNPVVEEGSVYDTFSEVFAGDWNTPGLFDKEGTPYELLKANGVLGETIDVTDFGATANDPEFDNTQAFKAAIDSATEGDEVFIPEGEFYFSTSSSQAGGYRAHINLQSYINLRGAGQDKTFLVSNFDPDLNENNSTTVILVFAEEFISMSDFTVTSVADENDLPDPDNSSINTTKFDAVRYGITIDNDRPTYEQKNIYVQNVTVEKFIRFGIRLKHSSNVVIEDSTFKKAFDLGGGGAGYGVSIQGRGWEQDFTDTSLDTIYNVIRNCSFEGPYLRHGVIIQYNAHNNLITNNTFTGTLLDAIDLHGEDEYSNEISFNTITDTRKGAGIGVGNSGATHDASGRNNLIYKNTITGGERGIDILYGSPNTIVYQNTISDLTEYDSFGIRIINGPGTQIIDNKITNVVGSDAFGISVKYSFNAFDPSIGIPVGLVVKDNVISESSRGFYIETYADDFINENNTYTNNSEYGYLTDTDTFVMPGISSEITTKEGTSWLPTDDNFITNEMPSIPQTQKNMKFKGSLDEIPYNRMIYIRFDLAEAPTNFTHVYLKFAAKSKDGLAVMNLYGSDSYTDWDEETISWNNALYHDPDYARIAYDDTTDDLVHITDLTVAAIGQEFLTYYVDITDYVYSIEDGIFTLILSNDALEGYYCEIYSKEQTAVSQQLSLVFSNEE